jgi:xanthine/uracil permease
MASHCKGWCWPAIIYLVLAAISLALKLLEDLSHLNRDDANAIRFAHFIFHLFWAVLWTMLFYWLCSNCHNTAAWVVLFLPVILGVAVLFFGTALITTLMLSKVVAGKQENFVERFEGEEGEEGEEDE